MMKTAALTCILAVAVFFVVNQVSVAVGALIREGEAEIINESCKPFVIRVLPS